MLRAVLDANVYVSAAIRPEGPPGRLLERFLRDRAFALVLSPPIVDEVQRALAYPQVCKYVRGAIDPGLWFEDLVILADLVRGERPVRACKDPDDDKYIAAALEGRASLVVTGDREFLALKEYEGIRIISPREFLRSLPKAV